MDQQLSLFYWCSAHQRFQAKKRYAVLRKKLFFRVSSNEEKPYPYVLLSPTKDAPKSLTDLAQPRKLNWNSLRTLHRSRRPSNIMERWVVEPLNTSLDLGLASTRTRFRLNGTVAHGQVRLTAKNIQTSRAYWFINPKSSSPSELALLLAQPSILSCCLGCGFQSATNGQATNGQPSRLDCRLFGSPTFNQPEPNCSLHLTPLRGAGEAGR